MGDTVFANGMSIACKVSSGKTIAAMPDVCLSPPSPPAGPIPIPYPNTAMASDTDQGSKTVQIGGQEVMLKNKSVFKTSSGNEAATKSFGMSVITHQIQGKASFVAWSMDIKFEGENVPRHLDLMGQNEASDPPSPPPWPFMSEQDLASADNACVKSGDAEKVQTKCTMPAANDYSEGCCAARACVLVPKSKECCSKVDPATGKFKVPTTPQTGHHVVPASQFNLPNQAGALPGLSSTYSYGGAPCICAVGGGHSTGEHGQIHTELNGLTIDAVEALNKDWISETRKNISPDARWNLGQSEALGAQAASEVTGCDKDCIEAQVRNGHNNQGFGNAERVRPSLAGKRPEPEIDTSVGPNG